MNRPQTIDVDQTATARVCSLRFRGICDGANLRSVVPHNTRHRACRMPKQRPSTQIATQSGTEKHFREPKRENGCRGNKTHSMCVWRFATGFRFSGVVVRVLRLLRRSRRDDDETERVADVNAFRTSIAGPAGWGVREEVKLPLPGAVWQVHVMSVDNGRCGDQLVWTVGSER